jgi:hypothetical protein
MGQIAKFFLEYFRRKYFRNHNIGPRSRAEIRDVVALKKSLLIKNSKTAQDGKGCVAERKEFPINTSQLLYVFKHFYLCI